MPSFISGQAQTAATTPAVPYIPQRLILEGNLLNSAVYSRNKRARTVPGMGKRFLRIFSLSPAESAVTPTAENERPEAFPRSGG